MEERKDYINKRKLTSKIIVTIIVLTLVIVLIFFSKEKFLDTSKAKEEGLVQIIICDYDGNQIVNDKWHFKQGDTLWEVIKMHYDGEDLKYEDTNEFGIKLLGIKGLNTKFTSGTYLALYCNDKYSSAGISSIKLVDGLVLKIVETRL